MNERQFTLDNRETLNEEQAGYFFLRKARERFDATTPQYEQLAKPADGSVAARIDRMTAYNPLSYQIGQLAMVAWDNVCAVFNYLEKVAEVPPTALYSLIRSSIEATSQGLFILNAGRHEKMAFQCIRFTYGNYESLESLGRVLDPSDGHDYERTKKRLRELRDQLGAYRHKDLSKRVEYTTLVAEADKTIRSRTYFNGLQVWKSCSGVAHANPSVIGVLLERVPTGEHDERGVTMMMTSRITFIAGFIMAAVENLEALITKYQALCKSPRR